MKKSMFVALALLLLTLPRFAAAETWAEFVHRAEAALSGAEGEAVVEAEWVESYGFGEDPDTGEIRQQDAALTVPGGKRLVIRGGIFEGMLLGGGEVRLEAATVRSYEDGQAAILLRDGAEGTDVLLELGPDTLVEAVGYNASAIACPGPEHGAGTDRPVRVVIRNQGWINAFGGSENGAIWLCYWNDGPSSVSLLVENEGLIQDGLQLSAVSLGDATAALYNLAAGRIIGGPTGTYLDAYSGQGHARVALENSGMMRTQELRPGRSVEDPTVSAVLRLGGDSGGLRPQAAGATGEMVIRNTGLVEEDCWFELWLPASPDYRLDWSDAVRGGYSFFPARFVLTRDTWPGEPEEEALLQEAQAWLRQQVLPALPEGTTMLAQVGEPETWEDLGYEEWKPYPGRPWILELPGWDVWDGDGLPTGNRLP